jgi:hypothetical protein
LVPFCQEDQFAERFQVGKMASPGAQREASHCDQTRDATVDVSGTPSATKQTRCGRGGAAQIDSTIDPRSGVPACSRRPGRGFDQPSQPLKVTLAVIRFRPNLPLGSLSTVSAPESLRLCAAALLTMFLASPVLAQQGSTRNAPAATGQAQNAEAVAPEIRGVLKNSDRVLEGLRIALDLTNPQEQRQYDTLREFIEVFLFGVDTTKPVRMDVITGGDATRYRLFVPIQNFNEFYRLNLRPLGIPAQRYAQRPELYRLGGRPADAFTGFMIYDANRLGGYAVIAERNEDLPRVDGPEPVRAVQHLLNAGYDAALQLQNRPDGLERRNEFFASHREEVLDRLKRDADETASDFNLRRFAAGFQYDETQRYYAESQNLIVGLRVSQDPISGSVQLQLEPLPETSLAESVELVGQQPSRFAGIPRGEDAATTGRIHLPLDDFRQKNLLALSQRFRENEIEELTAARDATPQQREAGTQFLNGFFDRIDAGLEAGVIDGFVESTRVNGGLYTMVGGIVSPNAQEWVPLLELLPQTRRGSDVRTNVGEHEGVAFHELTLVQDAHPDFYELFGDGRLLVGTGEDAVYYAAGPDADQALRQAIDNAAQSGEANGTIVSFRGELLPLVRIVNRRLGTRGQVNYRQMAIAAFQEGEGQISAELSRKGQELAVQGELQFDRGVMRFIGKALSEFSRQNLAE